MTTEKKNKRLIILIMLITILAISNVQAELTDTIKETTDDIIDWIKDLFISDETKIEISKLTDEEGTKITDIEKITELYEAIEDTKYATDTGLEETSGIGLNWIKKGITNRCLGINITKEIKETTPIKIILTLS